MNTCILIHNTSKKCIFSFFIVFFAISTLFTDIYSQSAPNAQYAGLTAPSGTPATGLTGRGEFNCAGMPDFDYTISGDIAPGDTSVPGPNQIIDNGGNGFELIYGPADFADNIEVEVAGFFGPVGSPISNTVTTTLDFDAATPPGEFSFIIADVEQDQVMICALDENGVPVPLSVINSWFVAPSFDADNSDINTIPPTWDTTTGTLVGQEGTGVKATTYQPDLPDNEAGAAWFTVNVPITQLQFKSQALGVAPDDPSQHFIFASTCAIYDLALIKEETSMGPYAPGDDVSYDITVCNQGNVDAFNVEITDNIPADMTLSTADPNGWAGPLAGPVINTIASIPVGACQVVPIMLTIDPAFMGTSITNNAEISMDDGNDIDSTPGDNSQPDDFPDDDDLLESDGGDDEDPEEIIVQQVYDLALIKETVTPGPYAPGQDVNYAITVCNQGTLNASNIVVTDNIPAGMTLSLSDPNGWAGPLVGPVTNGAILSLAPSTCQTLNILLTIDPAFMGTSLVNNAEISADDGNDIDSTPGDNSQPDDFADDNDLTETDGGDDEDPEEILIEQIYDLALIKTEASAGPYMPGDDVSFDITVCNQGSLDASNITVIDYIPADMTLSVADVNGWAGPLGGPVTNIIPSVLVGQCQTVPIILTINPTFAGTSLINDAEIFADDGNDVDSTPGNDGDPDDLPDDNSLTETDGGDDQDPEEIVVNPNVYDLALIKEESSAGPYSPGDDVTYTITIFNQGNVDAGFITIADVIPAGLSLSPNDINGWAGGPTGTVTNILLGPLAGAAPVTVDIVLTVDPNAMTGILINNAEIVTDNGDDVDSVPGDSSQPDDLADDNDPLETDGGDDEDPEPIEVCNCDSTVDAGTMAFPGIVDGCIDDTGSPVDLAGTTSGDAVIPAGYVQTFVLSNGVDFDVVDCSPTPNFTVSIPGWFTIHPLVYDPNTFDPCTFIGVGTIADIENLFATDMCVCGDVDPQGVEVGAYFCCNDMLQLDMNPIPPLLHDARISLHSAGTVDMPTSTTRFSGGQFVEMEPGFKIMPNSRFEAFIGPCSDVGN